MILKYKNDNKLFYKIIIRYYFKLLNNKKENEYDI